MSKKDEANTTDTNAAADQELKPSCPVCGGNLIEIRAKLQATIT